jgi:hypothetical protein
VEVAMAWEKAAQKATWVADLQRHAVQWLPWPGWPGEPPTLWASWKPCCSGCDGTPEQDRTERGVAVNWRPRRRCCICLRITPCFILLGWHDNSLVIQLSMTALNVISPHPNI